MMKRLDSLVKVDRRRQPKAIKGFKDYHEEIIENLKTGIVVTDEKLNVLTWNNYMEENYDITKEEVIGNNFLRCFPKLKEEGFNKIFARVLKGESYSDYMRQHETKRKGIRYFNVAFTPRKDTEGRVIGIVMNWNDVTEQKHAEEALKESEERYRLLAENITDVIWTMDMNLRVTYVSPSITHMLGYSTEEALTKNIAEGLTPASLKVAIKALAKELEVEKMEKKDLSRSRTLELEVIRKDGATIWTEVHVTFLRNLEGQPIGILGVVHDINERKGIEEKLTEKRKNLQALFESVADAVASLDKKNRVVEWNKAAEKMFGYTKEEVKGENIDNIVAPNEKHDEAVSMTKRILSSKEIVSFETTRYRKDGAPIEVMVSGAPIIADDKITGGVAVYKDITAKKALESQLTFAAQTLEKKVRDRTKELRRAYEQLKKAQKELVRKERLAVLGQLAGSVGHELRNPLGAIKNSVYFLDMVLKDKENKVGKHLGIINKEICVANEIISDLLDFSRVKPPQCSSVQLNELLNEVIAECYVPEHIKIVKKLVADLPKISVDQGQVHRVLLNIITNAIEAMVDGGQLQLESRVGDKTVTLAVSDTGTGIPKKNLEKIFHPLFTTKTSGLGLGLTVSKSLLEANNGKLFVKSEMNKGTTFYLKFRLDSRHAINLESHHG